MPRKRPRFLRHPAHAPRPAARGAPDTAPEPSPAPHRRSVRLGSVHWIDIPRPDDADVAELGREFGFHPLALEDCLARNQRPKLDDYDDYLFLALHFPVFQRAARSSLPAELDLFVGPDYLITLHDGALRPLAQLFERAAGLGAEPDPELGRSTGYLLYRILRALLDYCFPIVNKVGEHIDAVEEQIFAEPSFRTVQEISLLRRDIIALRRIVRPQVGVLTLLEHHRSPVFGEEMADYFGDVVDHVRKLWDILEDDKEVIDGLSATSDSLISHRINEVIKLLTVLSVTVLPLTLITDIFSMNVLLPGRTSPITTIVAFAAMALTSGALLVYFKRRGWL